MTAPIQTDFMPDALELMLRHVEAVASEEDVTVVELREALSIAFAAAARWRAEQSENVVWIDPEPASNPCERREEVR